MRYSLVLFCMTLSSVNSQGLSDAARDYGLGRTVGECLISGCQVFRGFLLTESPAPGEPAKVEVTEQLFGPPLKADIVGVPFADPNDVRKSGTSPNRAWRGGAALSRNAPLTVVLALERIGDVKPGDPVRVVSDGRRSAIIRSFSLEAARLDASPESIADSVASLSREPNPALSGYLFARLTRLETVRRPELECTFLMQMIANPGVPSEAWSDIAEQLVLNYHRLSPGGRLGVVRRFAELGQSHNIRTAVLGFNGLARIGSFDGSLRALLGPAVVGGLTDSYRMLVRKGDMPRNRDLEDGLKIRYQ